MENSILVRNITIDELKAFIKESIKDELQSFLKRTEQNKTPERLSLIETAQYL